MDANSFFIQKLAIEIIETITADEKGISSTHIDLARRHKWFPGITIHQYVLILQCWKIVQKLQKGSQLNELQENILNMKRLTDFQRKVALYIIKYWFETNKLAYALSDTIAVFQNESADSDTFIRNLITRANPYLLGGK